MVNKPTYTLHPSYPVKRVAWRPGYECELAVISNEELSVPGMESHPSLPPPTPGLLSRVGSGLGLDSMLRNLNYDGYMATSMEGRVDRQNLQATPAGETIELWDVRREYMAKWSVSGSSAEGSISGRSLICACNLSGGS
jgi:WD repeat-containing protein 24